MLLAPAPPGKEDLRQKRNALFLALMPPLLALGPVWAKASSDPLKAYTSCRFEDGLRIVEATRRPTDAEKFREVQTAKGIKRVSVIDGYRIMVAYPNPKGRFFANIKAELSGPEAYSKDKQAVMEQLVNLAQGKEMDGKKPRRASYHGFESQGIDCRSLDACRGGGEWTMGVHVLTSDADRTITTIYFLGAEPGFRKFQTIGEYHQLRDRFLARYAACVRKNTRQP